MADIVHNPSVIRTKKLQGVHYLVIGSVVKLGNLAISARLVDVSTGQIAQTAEVSANDALGLQSALEQLASILAMTPEEKKNYFDERRYPSLVKEARRLAADKKYDPALRLYRRILSIRFNESLQQELIDLERERQSNTVFVEIQGSGCASKVELTYATYERPMLLVRSEDGSIRALLVQDGFLIDFDDRQAFEEYVAEYEFMLVMAFSGDGLSLRNRKTDSVFDSLVMGSRMGVWGFKEHGGADVELYYLEESPRRIRLTAKLSVSRFSPEYSVPDFNKLQECDAGEIHLQIRGPFVVYEDETP